MKTTKKNKTMEIVAINNPDVEVRVEDGMYVIVLAAKKVTQHGGVCAAYNNVCVTQYGGQCTANGSVNVEQYGGTCVAEDKSVVDQYGGHTILDGMSEARVNTHA